MHLIKKLRSKKEKDIFVPLEPPLDQMIKTTHMDTLNSTAAKWQNETGHSVKIQLSTNNGQPAILISARKKHIENIRNEVEILVADIQLCLGIEDTDRVRNYSQALKVGLVDDESSIPQMAESKVQHNEQQTDSSHNDTTLLAKETIHSCEVTASVARMDHFPTDAIIVPAEPNLSTGHSYLVKTVYREGMPHIRSC